LCRSSGREAQIPSGPFHLSEYNNTIILKKGNPLKKDMITYRKYIQEKTNEGTMKEIIKTTLEAKLIFKKETAPVYRNDVRERICAKAADSDYSKNTLPGYLKEVEGLLYNKELKVYEDANLDNIRKISIKERPWKLGIDVKVISPKNLKPEDMLNLEGLNHFIQENSSK
jgi:hypothetical protein